MNTSQLKKLVFIVTLSVLVNLSYNAYAQESPNKIDCLTVLENINRHYPKIKIAHLEIAKAHAEWIKAQGKFDPALEASGRSQPMGGYINNYGDTQLTIPTLYNGVKFFAGYRNGEGNWPIYYQNYLTNSAGEYRAGLSFPLLKNRLIDKERTKLLSSAQLIIINKHNAEAVKLKIYQEAIKAYWQWVEAGRQVKIFEKLLNLAQKRQHAIEEQAKQGDLSELAVSENLQQIMQRKQLLNQGQMIFEQAGINLSLYYRDKNGYPIIPTEKNLPSLLVTSSTPSHNHDELKGHPEIKKINHYTEIVKLKRNLARNDLLPQLDGNAYTFKQNGTGGYPGLIPQAAMLGISFKFPLLQREAKGTLIQAENQLRQIKLEKKFLYEQLSNEYNRMYIGIQRNSKQIKLLQKELNLAKKIQIGETKKFYQGDSTLFLVNQREQSSTQIELNYVHAQIELEELKTRVRFFSSAQQIPSRHS